MNNFRLIGARYISKDGIDVSDGLTPDTPKATIANYGAGIHVIGSGNYKGAINFSPPVNANPDINCDGYCKINATGNLLFGNQSVGGSFYLNRGIGANRLDVELNGNSFYANAANSTNQFNFLTLRNGVFVANNFTGNIQVILNNCVIEDCTSSDLGAGGHTRTYNKVLFFNCTSYNIEANTTIKSCFLDSSSLFIMPSYFTTPSTKFINCNFRGRINVGGTIYELKKDRNGVDIPSRVGNGILDLSLIDATVYDRGNFSQDPEFLNIDKRDYFSVSATSPMIFGASDGSNIGGVSFARLIKSTDGEFTGGQINGLELSANDLTIVGALDEGDVQTLIIQIAPTAQPIVNSRIAALLAFNSDEIAGTAENTNVPAKENFAPATTGANPRRLTYEMVWTSNEIAPTTLAEFDNQGYTPTGQFVVFEHFQKPLVDVLGIGNGDPLFNAIGAVGVLAKYVGLKITLQKGLG